jgi:hypothetical protein
MLLERDGGAWRRTSRADVGLRVYQSDVPDCKRLRCPPVIGVLVLADG